MIITVKKAAAKPVMKQMRDATTNFVSKPDAEDVFGMKTITEKENALVD